LHLIFVKQQKPVEHPERYGYVKEHVGQFEEEK